MNSKSVSITLDWEKLAWVIVLILAICSRFYNLGERVISHDESLHTHYSWQLYRGQGFQHTPLMHGPFQFHALAFSYFLFGASDFTARIPAAVFGVVAVGLLWCFRGWIGRSGALVSGVLMTISPYFLYYSRYVRNEAFVVVWALLMAIATFRYFETRKVSWIYLMVAVVAFHHATKEVAFIYQAIWMLFIFLRFVQDILTTQWHRPRMKTLFRVLFVVGLAAIVSALAFHGLGGQLATLLSDDSQMQSAAEPAVGAELDTTSPLLANHGAIVAAGIGLTALTVAVLVAFAGLRHKLRQFPSLDLLVILSTLMLPLLVAFPVKLLLHSDPLDYSMTGMWRTGPVLIGMTVLSIAVGVAWDWRKWLFSAAIFWGIYFALFTTMFSNGGGLASGVVGSLGYWLDQQAVERGSQPWYYYLIVQIPLYEYLTAFGVMIASWVGLRHLVISKDVEETSSQINDEVDSVATANRNEFPVKPFLVYWMIMAFVSYTIAGEKMPWLTIHIVLPMLLLAGWGIGQVLDGSHWRDLLGRGGMIVIVLIPVCLSALSPILWQLSGVNPPFQGTELSKLQATMGFLSATIVFIGGAIGLYSIGRRLRASSMGRLTLLVGVGMLILLTIRTSIIANYINFDNQTEFINYASGAPGIKVAMQQVEELSQRTTDGLGIRVAYDDDVSWPFTWYLRDYTNGVYFGGQPTRDTFRDTPLVIAGDSNWDRVEPLLGNNYYSFEYIRMWWPMQEYFNLTRERVAGAILDPAYREAIWNIWLRRDYTRYGELTGVDYSLSNWPVVDRMRLYIRKDLSSQLWNLGVGPTVLESPVVLDRFEDLWVSSSSELMWGGEGRELGQFQNPRSVAIGPQGFVYVTDTLNHRVQKFDDQGTLLKTWGGFGSITDSEPMIGKLNEPWGLDVGADGSVYVADTWNHRVQKYSNEGQFVDTWGHFGNDADLYNMWGPRAIAVGPEGNVYVADTGNKRILVFDANGIALRQIGSGGVLEGELDEPVGIAVGSNGEVYVADTWNQRVQVFSGDGVYLRHWEVLAWFGQSLDNKPYLDVDGHDRVYVSDPEGYRIYAWDGMGEALFAWGYYGTDESSFALPSGLSVDADGAVYVVDSANHRIMRFDVNSWVTSGK